MFRKVFVRHVLFLLLLISGGVTAGLFNRPAGSTIKRFRYSDFPDPVPQGEQSKIILPLKRVGNLILVEVRIDTLVGNLILDTGAPHLILNSTYFRHYPRYGEVTAGGITGSTGGGTQTVVQRLDFGGLYFKKVDADMVSLGHLESIKGVKILGLLGLNLLKKLEVILDLKNNRLILYRLNRSGTRLANDSLQQTLSSADKLTLYQQQGILLLYGRLGGKQLRFCMDTGAETNVLHSGLPGKVMREVEITGRSWINGTGSNRTEVLSGIIHHLEIGNRRYEQLAGSIVNLSGISQAYGCSIDGMLGIDFMSRHTLCFNLMKGELYLW